MEKKAFHSLASRLLVTVILMVIVQLLFSACWGKGKSVYLPPESGYFKVKAEKIMNSLIDKTKDRTFDRVAIIDIVNSDGRVSFLGRYITIKLTESLLNSTDIVVIPKGQIKEVMKAQKIKPAQFYGNDTIQKLSEQLGVDTIILGELIDLSGSIELNLKMIDARSGEIMAVASDEIESVNAIIKLMKDFRGN